MSRIVQLEIHCSCTPRFHSARGFVGLQIAEDCPLHGNSRKAVAARAAYHAAARDALTRGAVCSGCHYLHRPADCTELGGGAAG